MKQTDKNLLNSVVGFDTNTTLFCLRFCDQYWYNVKSFLIL